MICRVLRFSGTSGQRKTGKVSGNCPQGTGHSKQEAEREAARNALTDLEKSDDSTLEGVG